MLCDSSSLSLMLKRWADHSTTARWQSPSTADCLHLRRHDTANVSPAGIRPPASTCTSIEHADADARGCTVGVVDRRRERQARRLSMELCSLGPITWQRTASHRPPCVGEPFAHNCSCNRHKRSCLDSDVMMFTMLSAICWRREHFQLTSTHD